METPKIKDWIAFPMKVKSVEILQYGENTKIQNISQIPSIIKKNSDAIMLCKVCEIEGQ